MDGHLKVWILYVSIFHCPKNFDNASRNAGIFEPTIPAGQQAIAVGAHQVRPLPLVS